MDVHGTSAVGATVLHQNKIDRPMLVGMTDGPPCGNPEMCDNASHTNQDSHSPGLSALRPGSAHLHRISGKGFPHQGRSRRTVSSGQVPSKCWYDARVFLYVSDVDPDQSDGRAPPECPTTPSPVSRSLAGHYRSWIDGRVTTSDTRARSSPRGGVIRLPAV